jgi:hypothetical protein
MWQDKALYPIELGLLFYKEPKSGREMEEKNKDDVLQNL